jgi:hypothetical protein
LDELNSFLRVRRILSSAISGTRAGRREAPEGRFREGWLFSA